MAAASVEDNVDMKCPLNDTAKNVKDDISSKIRLADLKVTDLRAELAKRNCDKSGVKAVLIERLKKALTDDGLDPEDFAFETVKNTNKTQMKQDAELNGSVEDSNDEIYQLKEESATEVASDQVTDKKEEMPVEVKEELKEDAFIEMKEIDEDSDKDVPMETEEVDAKKRLSFEVKDENEESDVLVELTEETEAAKDPSVSSEEKNINEVTLQISIDEEEAQLNEDEGMEISKSSDTEVEIKAEEKVTFKEAPKAEPVETTSSGSKPTKENNEDVKEKKATKTVATTKPSETSSAVSPKVLKVLGKNDKVKSSSVLAKSLWVTGLPNTTRAADLKELFSKQGRVLSVKIVKSTKQAVGKCYGFVTMANSRDATKAIQELHRTELNGRVISVERTQSEPNVLLKKTESRPPPTPAKKPIAKKEEKPKVFEAKKTTSEPKADSKMDTKKVETKAKVEAPKSKEEISKTPDKAKSKDREQKSREHRDREVRRSSDRRAPVSRPRRFGVNDRPRFGASRRPVASRPFLGRPRFQSNFRPRPEQSMYERMREERIRLRERERREDERRRLEEQRYVERRQREEAIRLEREKERLRIERELLERERAEMLKLEREKQRLERERLEREREELRRQAELRRSAVKRPFTTAPRNAERYWDDRKKLPPRFEERPAFRTEKRIETPRYEFPTRERASAARHEYERRPERFTPAAAKVIPSRSTDFGDRDSRRDVTVRSRDERSDFDRNSFRDGRRIMAAPRETARSSRRETSRDGWKQDRRINERIVTSTSSSSGQRRVNYY